MPEKAHRRKQMGTKFQNEANQKNALKSTGPQTEAGKEISSRNAVKHGLTAKMPELLPDEIVSEYEEFREILWNDLKPVGAVEEMLAERIINGFWRIRRIDRIEGGAYGFEINNYTVQEIIAKELKTIPPLKYHEDDPAGLARCFNALTNKTDFFSKLSRYETAIDRMLAKNMEKLEQLQKQRRNSERQDEET